MSSQESISARINFGVPSSEYILKANKLTGAAISCYNQDTDTEYIGGGGGGDSDFGTAEVKIEPYTSNPDYIPVPETIIKWPVYYNGTFDFINNQEPVELPITFEIPLFNNKQVYTDTFLVDTTEIPEPDALIGNIAFNDDTRRFEITGDCTIQLGILK